MANQIVVPEIHPQIIEVLNRKTFSAFDIKWVKNANNSSTGNLASSVLSETEINMI